MYQQCNVWICSVYLPFEKAFTLVFYLFWCLITNLLQVSFMFSANLHHILDLPATDYHKVRIIKYKLISFTSCGSWQLHICIFMGTYVYVCINIIFLLYKYPWLIFILSLVNFKTAHIFSWCEQLLRISLNVHVCFLLTKFQRLQWQIMICEITMGKVLTFSNKSNSPQNGCSSFLFLPK